MTGLPLVENYRGLLVYQKARALAREVFLLTKDFPKEEAYSLTDQVRRSSRAIGANIAESWGKRRYERHFVSKLTDADSEQYETQHWIEIAYDCRYITAPISQKLCTDCHEVSRLINGMIHKSATFCLDNPTVLKEESAEYFVIQEQ
ncbi:MAG: four helix bundle protein [Chloroflexi bacterium]|nr:four helix bundle protein [Chloroflexota bacterium]